MTESNAYRKFRETLRRARRWQQDRCTLCGHRFAWRQGRFSNGPGTGPQHESCNAARHWRLVADERLTVLDVLTDVWDVTSTDVQELVAGRLPEREATRGRNLGWRVVYDVEKRREALAAEGQAVRDA